MIYTLTLNPAIDMNFTAYLDTSVEVNRAKDLEYSANGKGINVSIVLKYFGLKSKAIGFFGGFTGRYIVDELIKKEIDVVPFWIEDNTRINVFVSNPNNGECKFVNEGSFIPSDKQFELLNYIKELDDCECLIVSGSLPKNIEYGYYKKISEICKDKNIKLIVDISSKELSDILVDKPFLIKPNDEEVKAIFDFDIKSEEDILNILRELHKRGAQNIILSLGERGMYFFNGINIYYAGAKKIKLLSSACAGDSALASFLSVWLLNESDLEFALKRASAVGASVAESSGLGDLSKVKEYIKEINIREVF